MDRTDNTLKILAAVSSILFLLIAIKTSYPAESIGDMTVNIAGKFVTYELILFSAIYVAGVMFETFLDDDGSIKDIVHSAEIISAIRQNQSAMDRYCERIEAAQREIPSSIEAHLCDEDRNRLDTNFIRLKNLIKLNLPIVIGIGALVGICLIGSIMVCNSAANKRHKYEQRITELDGWHQENAEAISFRQFYRENYPKKYREWQTGRWQQDIAYRDSLIRTLSLDRLNRLPTSTE